MAKNINSKLSAWLENRFGRLFEIFRRSRNALIKSMYFNAKRRIEFYHMLNILTTNGVSIQAALTLIKKKMFEMRLKNSSLNIIISDLLRDMSRGVPFHRALAKWIPNNEYILIEASHKDIPNALKIVHNHTRHISYIRSAIFSALAYPCMMFLLLIATLLIFAFYIMPNMEKLTPVTNWPPISYNLYIIANFLREHILTIAAAFLAIIVFCSWSLANLSVIGLRNILDRIPPWNIYKTYVATSLLIALSSSIKLGMSFNTAIAQLKEISSPYLTRLLRRVQLRLMRGSNFGDAIDIGLFDMETLVILSVFSITNKIEQGVQYIADKNTEQQQQVFIRRGKVIGYLIMAFAAVIIGWIVLAMYGIQSSVTVS